MPLFTKKRLMYRELIRMHHLPLLVVNIAGDGLGVDIDVHAGLVGVAQDGEVTTGSLVTGLPEFISMDMRTEHDIDACFVQNRSVETVDLGTAMPAFGRGRHVQELSLRPI